jgi:hypothetical protein
MKRERITGELFDFDVAKKRYGGSGRTLGSFLADTVNGVDLPLDGPDGNIHMVSLAPFAGEDPDHFLLFTFIESREDEPFDDEDNNAVVLTEYDLPPDAKSLEVTPPDCGDGMMLKKYELPPDTKTLD